LRHAAGPLPDVAAPFPVAEHPLAGRNGSAVPTEFEDSGEPESRNFVFPVYAGRSTFSGTGPMNFD
jgi:hypothetical protein